MAFRASGKVAVGFQGGFPDAGKGPVGFQGGFPDAGKVAVCKFPGNLSPGNLSHVFEGHGITESMLDAGAVMPNTIRIFQVPHEEVCDTREELQAEVTRTMHHELAHHFGLDDDYLEAIGAY